MFYYLYGMFYYLRTFIIYDGEIFARKPRFRIKFRVGKLNRKIISMSNTAGVACAKEKFQSECAKKSRIIFSSQRGEGELTEITGAFHCQ